MLLTIADILSSEQFADIDRLLGTLAWRDGKETAGSVAKAVKSNEQADLTSRSGVKLRDLLLRAILTHPIIRAAAQPRRFSKLIVSRTGENGGYGLHVDNAFMGHGDQLIRTDLSFTLFLNEPAEYHGGELSIEYAGHTQSLKPDAGHLILYPSTSLHEVRPVMSGERLVCVGWIESHIPRSEDRETLFDLENLRATLSNSHSAQSPEMLTLSKSIANLKRRFCS